MSTTRMTTEDRAANQGERRFGIYLAFARWILFTLITQHATLRAAAIAALVAAVAIAVPSLTARRPQVLELGPILAFAGFAVVAFSADPATSAWVARYARPPPTQAEVAHQLRGLGETFEVANLGA